MSSAVLPPDELPPGYEWLDDEEEFDPDRHLRLEPPADVIMLADLGYSPEEIAATATAVAMSTAFRLLSDEGAALMLTVARRLRPYAAAAGDRIERTVRGGCYRSRWLRDLCLEPAVTDHLAGIYGAEIAPHPMALQLGHLNYEPSRIDLAVDKWHHDTLPLDYVLAVTDPATVDGGDFQYFAGTKQEVADLTAAGEPLPHERIVTPDLPGPGWALALHGDMVVHRVTPLRQLTERISMVNGYVSLDPRAAAQDRSGDLIGVDDPEVLWTEWARYAAWRSSRKLTTLVEEMRWTSDRVEAADQLAAAIAEVESTIAQMRTADGSTFHYGD